MIQKKAAPFDPGMYLAKVRGGETVKEYRKKHAIFVQGSPADAVFYVERGKVKLTVLSARGKEAVVAILGSGDFSVKEAWLRDVLALGHEVAARHQIGAPKHLRRDRPPFVGVSCR